MPRNVYGIGGKSWPSCDLRVQHSPLLESCLWRLHATRVLRVHYLGLNILARLELQAPGEIPPGASVQLTADAVKPDGSVENVSSQAVWTPQTSDILQISPSGLPQEKREGKSLRPLATQVSAPARASWSCLRNVPPLGHHQGGRRRRPGVAVTVISGVGEGLTTTSDVGGVYVLYGVSGTVRIRLRREAYLEAIHEVSATAHRTADFDIVAARPRTDYRGTYRLTITAAPTCRSLAESAKLRHYTADVAQDGSRLTVTLRDANFIVVNGRGNGFTGNVDINDTIRFTIGDVFPYYDYYYATLFDIAERVDAETVATAGIMSSQGSPALISGRLNGSIVVSLSTTPPFQPSTSYCGSPSHGFEMVRR